MAIAVYGDEYDKLNGVPSQMVRPDEFKGRVRISRTSYTTNTTDGSFTTGSTVTGVPLPKGARLVDAYLIAEDIGGTSTTLKLTLNAVDIIGATNFGDGAAIARMAAAAAPLVIDAVNVGGYAPIITSGADTASDGKTFTAIILYVTD